MVPHMTVFPVKHTQPLSSPPPHPSLSPTHPASGATVSLGDYSEQNIQCLRILHMPVLLSSVESFCCFFSQDQDVDARYLKILQISREVVSHHVPELIKDPLSLGISTAKEKKSKPEKRKVLTKQQHCTQCLNKFRSQKTPGQAARGGSHKPFSTFP